VATTEKYIMTTALEAHIKPEIETEIRSYPYRPEGFLRELGAFEEFFWLYTEALFTARRQSSAFTLSAFVGVTPGQFRISA
jgi:hypothetical protein